MYWKRKITSLVCTKLTLMVKSVGKGREEEANDFKISYYLLCHLNGMNILYIYLCKSYEWNYIHICVSILKNAYLCTHIWISVYTYKRDTKP